MELKFNNDRSVNITHSRCHSKDPRVVDWKGHLEIRVDNHKEVPAVAYSL